MFILTSLIQIIVLLRVERVLHFQKLGEKGGNIKLTETLECVKFNLKECNCFIIFYLFLFMFQPIEHKSCYLAQNHQSIFILLI